MAQGNVEFTKKVTYQKGKTDYADIVWNDAEKIRSAQHILNAQINSGDLVTDVEMPAGVLGATLDWGEGVVDDLLVGITTGAGNRVSIVQDLGSENLKVEYQDRFTMEGGFKVGGGTITIPSLEGYIADFYVDWGDGTFSDITSWDDDPAKFSHFYSGIFRFEIKGKCEYLKFSTANGINTLTEMKSAQNLKVVGFPYSTIRADYIDPSWSKWENVEEFIDLFRSDTSLLIEELPAGLFASCSKVTRFEGTFDGCNYTAGTAIIPENIFPYMPLLTNVSRCFKNNIDATSIPSGLFDDNPLITDFSEVFSSCSGITTAIPTDLFKLHISATNFSNTFYRCYGLPNTLPTDIFRYNTEVTDFSGVFDTVYLTSVDSSLFEYNTKVLNFSHCLDNTSITTMPVDLFRYNVLATNFSFAFYGADITTIQTDLFRYNIAATDFSFTFYGTDITTLPSDLFEYNTLATNFTAIFYNCTSLTTLPADLFRYNTAVTEFTQTFYNSGLTSLPVDLFRYNVLVEEFIITFGYTDITTLPVDLFRYNIAVTSFSSLFRNCSSLTTIPATLFDDNTAVINFNSVFNSCTSLTTIPIDLFRYNVLVEDFGYTFQDVPITSIPVDLFRYNTAATDFTNLFVGSEITSIPVDLFRYNTAAITFYGVFQGNNLLKEIPADLFEYNIIAEEFPFTFDGCSSLTSIPIDLFRYNIAATNFSRTFSSWPLLTTIPVDLFRYNTEVTAGFGYTFYNCTSLREIPVDLFRYNTKVVTFTYCFYNCEKLYDVPDNLFQYNTLTTNFYRTFYACESLKGTVTGTGELYDWMQSHSPTNVGYCFYYCPGIQDWDLIPATWSGGGLAALTNTMTLYFDGSSADWDLTLGINTSVNTGMNIDVDWGDGSGITTITDYTSSDATHNYTNGLTSNTLTIKGKLQYLDLSSISELASIGATTRDIGLTTFRADDCTGLASVDAGFKQNRQISGSIINMFFGCTSLSSIGLIFDYAYEITNFTQVFQGCTLLTSLPSGLFDSCISVTSFLNTFKQAGLTSIPTDLFKYTTKVTNFNSTFRTTDIVAIPTDTFRYNIAVTDFGGTFYDCTSLTTIPADVFRYNTLAEDFDILFYGDTSIINLPADLFLYNTSIININICFKNSNSITTAVTGAGNLIAQVETNNPAVNKTGCFDGCTSVTDYASIPIGASDWRTS